MTATERPGDEQLDLDDALTRWAAVDSPTYDVRGEHSRQAATAAKRSPEDFQKNFNDAIKKSLEQEKVERQGKHTRD